MRENEVSEQMKTTGPHYGSQRIRNAECNDYMWCIMKNAHMELHYCHFQHMSPFAVVFHSDMCSGFENIII
jgi:hypothetical protein